MLRYLFIMRTALILFSFLICPSSLLFHPTSPPQALANTELFHVDRLGSKAARKRVEEDAAAASRKTALSSTEHKLIKRKVRALQAGEPTKQQQRLAAVTGNKGARTAVSDPWGDDIYSPIAPPAARDIAEEVLTRKTELRGGQGLKAAAPRQRVRVFIVSACAFKRLSVRTRGLFARD